MKYIVFDIYSCGKMDRRILYIRSHMLYVTYACSHCIMTQSVKMRGAVIILYFTGFLIKASSENAAHEMQSKIIGGHPIDIKSRPFMLSLHESSQGFVCGASIISRKFAITALHCLRKSVQFYVRAGSNRMDKDGHMHKVTNIHVYNDTYNHFLQVFYHDIALLEVTPPFHFSKTVRPVRLPKSNYRIQRQLLVCGWGSTKPQKVKTPEVLMGVYVEYVPFEICSSYYASIKNDYHLCYGTRGKDACFGDSGGPLASKKTIYGIVSFGRGCGNITGVYVKVSYYLEWIKDIMNL